MKKQTVSTQQIIELEALRFYGQEGPLAIVHHQGQRKVYSMLGIDTLISTSNDNYTQPLR